ncbi:MAG: FAD-dependent oxidoreductase [Flavobacteriales bacterium]|nr:FAD-dependent oxidoreductase [Flavobacteriales bacterium]
MENIKSIFATKDIVLKDFFIVGQGLAGSVLAVKLEQMGKSFKIFDSPNPNTSSAVAAGIMNPVSGKRYVPVWRASEIFSVAFTFYRFCETKLAGNFFYEMPLYRIFGSIAEQNEWMGKAGNDKVAPFLNEHPDSILKLNEEIYSNPHYSLSLKGGRLEVAEFVNKVRNRLVHQGIFSERHISPSIVMHFKNHVSIDGEEAKQIIFCTGLDDGFWSFLPFIGVKGELLEVASDALERDRIVVGASFLTPSAKHFYLGATYNWDDKSLMPTEQAREELINNYYKFAKPPIEIKNQRVGFRPTVRDRKPLLGMHPEYPNLFLFGGLGSKGVSLAPYLADRLLEFIIHEKGLDSEINLNRFKK